MFDCQQINKTFTISSMTYFLPLSLTTTVQPQLHGQLAHPRGLAVGQQATMSMYGKPNTRSCPVTEIDINVNVTVSVVVVSMECQQLP